MTADIGIDACYGHVRGKSNRKVRRREEWRTSRLFLVTWAGRKETLHVTSSTAADPSLLTADLTYRQHACGHNIP